MSITRHYLVVEFYFGYIIKLQNFLKKHNKTKRRHDILLLFAAFIGDISLLEKSKKRGLFLPDIKFCYLAILGDQIETLEWAHNNNCPLNSYICEYAAQKGNLKILQWTR